MNRKIEIGSIWRSYLPGNMCVQVLDVRDSPSDNADGLKIVVVQKGTFDGSFAEYTRVSDYGCLPLIDVMTPSALAWSDEYTRIV